MRDTSGKEWMNEKIDCEVVREAILAKAKEEIKGLSNAPKLAIVQVGDRQDSNKYIRNKIKACEECGIEVELFKYDEEIQCEVLKKTVVELQKECHAIIVQCPLPSHIDEDEIMKVIDPKKDCDGLNFVNVGKLHTQNNGAILPATPQGIMEVFNYNGIDLEGKGVLLVGRSNLVNRPLLEAMLQENATVTIVHSKTKHLQEELTFGGYDIVVSAIGKAKELKFIIADYIIDVGINVDENGKLCGDVDIEKCKCQKYTPVPKGIGVTTVACIILNVIKCYKMQIEE